jgi:mannan endo-1,4-beta-mannosidase
VSAPAVSGSLADHRGTAIATPAASAMSAAAASSSGTATPSGATTATLSGAGTATTSAPTTSSTPGSSFAAPPAATPKASSPAAAGASPTPTPTATPTPTPAPTATPTLVVNRAPGGGSSGFVTACGDQLCLNGKVWTFTGVNAYEAATDWGVNYGCGTMLSNSALDSLFSSLQPNDVVRFWAFQALATNYTTGQLDWAGIDRVIDAAAAYGIKVIPSLTDETGLCDDNEWKDAAWYSGGYNNVYDPNETPSSTPLPYSTYLQDFLQRYGDNPTIAMVELVSEPSPTESGYDCVGETAAAQALRSFFDTEGSEAHSLAPNLLVESGLQGEGQCGTEGSDYGYVMASPGVDVASVHDYTDQVMPTTAGSDLVSSLQQARADGKPLIMGEVGEAAQADLSGCPSLTSRVSLMQAKMTAQFSAGVSGFLVWDWEPTAPTSCMFDFGPGDPLIAALDSQ